MVLQRVGGGEEPEQDRALFPMSDDGRANSRRDHQEVDADRMLQKQIAQRLDGGEGAAGDVGEDEERDRDLPRRGGEVLEAQRQRQEEPAEDRGSSQTPTLPEAFHVTGA